MTIEELSERHRPALDGFARSFHGDRFYTYFEHASVEDVIEHPRGVSFVAIVDHDAVGWVHALPGEGRKRHVARVGIAVRDGYRGRGIGTELLLAIMRETRRGTPVRPSFVSGAFPPPPRIGNLGTCDKLVATVFADNESSLRLFHAAGFLEEGRYIDEERWGTEHRDVVSLAWRRQNVL